MDMLHAPVYIGILSAELEPFASPSTNMRIFTNVHVYIHIHTYIYIYIHIYVYHHKMDTLHTPVYMGIVSADKEPEPCASPSTNMPL